jgi:hypothetical protein
MDGVLGKPILAEDLKRALALWLPETASAPLEVSQT